MKKLVNVINIMIMPQVQDFSYEREVLSLPCNMTLTQSYETQRDLIIGMAYHRGNTIVTQRSYSYDTLGRPLTRSTTRSGQTVNKSLFISNDASQGRWFIHTPPSLSSLD